eukprot:TRINITY_DN1124_c0_g1_i1.p1 TRINITY_DN1124_c0_g1~~TRINITY_DN1124_c0_g1_i1.p1  ORF type:complete len:433 (-),score=131.48 TRINITY_DN1124_c0_g1_i1:15-1313(-)
MSEGEWNRIVKNLDYLNRLSKKELRSVLKDTALFDALLQFSIEGKSSKKSKIDENAFSNVGRRSIMNEGNTCYLNSALQAMRNSLYYAQDLEVGPFGKKLKNFYEGRERSLVGTLERELGANLRRQSDSAEYFNKVCKLLESEGSSALLDKIKLKNNVVTWTCSNCQFTSDDTRGSRVAAYSLALIEPGHTQTALSQSLHYERDRTCKQCQHEVLHRGHKHFDVQHLTIVASDPYLQKLQVDLHFDLDHTHYELISAVLHSGGTSGGHYIALVKDESGTWSSCNDSYIQNISPSELKSYLSRWTTTQVIYKVQKISVPVEEVVKKEPVAEKDGRAVVVGEVVDVAMSEGVAPATEPDAPPSTEEVEEVDEVEDEVKEVKEVNELKEVNEVNEVKEVEEVKNVKEEDGIKTIDEDGKEKQPAQNWPSWPWSWN